MAKLPAHGSAIGEDAYLQQSLWQPFLYTAEDEGGDGYDARKRANGFVASLARSPVAIIPQKRVSYRAVGSMVPCEALHHSP